MHGCDNEHFLFAAFLPHVLGYFTRGDSARYLNRPEGQEVPIE